MSMLDQMLIEGVRRTAPENKPWNAGQFLTNVGQFVNTGERINELQRQNSLRNLIKQREQDGVSFDRLSNEAAKYDLNKALTMRNEARDSIKFNRTESEAELANHKKYMAGWLGGKVLRRAQDAVARGDAQWDIDYVVNVCNETAATIYPYDPEGARALMQYANGLSGKKLTAGAKKEKALQRAKDDHKQMEELQLRYAGMKADAQIDPSTKETAGQAAARLRWILGKMDIEGLPVYSWMNDYFYGGDWEKKLDKLRNSLNWDKYFENPGAQHPYFVDDLVPKKPVKSATNVGKNGKVVKGQTEETGAENTGKGKEYSYVEKHHDNWSNSDYYAPYQDFYERAVNDINDAENVQDLNKIIGALTRAVNQSNGDDVKDIKKIAESKIKSINEFEKDMQEAKSNYGIAEEDFQKFRELFGTRATTTIIRQWKNFHAFTSSYLSKNPGTAINNALLVENPDYKPTDYDAKVSLYVQNPDDVSDEVRGQLAQMDIPVISKMAKYGMYKVALQAIAPDVLSTIQGAWQGYTTGSDPEKYQKQKELYSKMFGLNEEDWSLIEGQTSFPTGKEYEEQLGKKIKNTKSKPAADLTGTKKPVVNSGSSNVDKDAELKAFLEGK